MPPLATHTAPGQALGYFFQLERALSWLAKAPADSNIGIETEDDVVISLQNGEKIFEQDKSSTTTHPFLPSRKDLWKTLLLWLEGISSGEIDLDRSYFFLVTNKSGKDSIAKVLSDAKKETDISNALLLLKQKGSDVTGEVKTLVDKCFSFEETTIKKLIKRISFQGTDSFYGDGLHKKLESDLQLDMEASEQNTSVINELTGWVFRDVVSKWTEKKPALIDRNSFHRLKIKILTNHRQTVVNKLIFDLGEIPKSEQTAQLKNVYAQQLRLINLTEDEIFSAINDYLNSVSKRTLLATKGYLTGTELEDLDRNLESHWNSIFRSRSISHKNLHPAEIGQIIFFDTTDYDTMVGQYVLKSHFITKGSYHALADALKVGWHPEFKLFFQMRGKELSPAPKKKPRKKKHA